MNDKPALKMVKMELDGLIERHYEGFRRTGGGSSKFADKLQHEIYIEHRFHDLSIYFYRNLLSLIYEIEKRK